MGNRFRPRSDPHQRPDRQPHADGAEKDLVINNKTGYIYSNLNEASEYIRNKSKSEWKTMGAEAEKLIYSEHSLESMTEKFLSKVRN